MIITSQELREHWRQYREEALSGETFVVTYWDSAFAVLISHTIWNRGLQSVPVEASRCVEYSVGESRTKLATLFKLAREGQHSVVSNRGDQETVLVPHAWALEALPEVVEAAVAPPAATAGEG